MSVSTPRGVYLLQLRIDKAVDVEVGSLGTIRFEPGDYLYAGSALNGLDRRLRRHFSSEKGRRWHIDYLTCLFRPSMALILPTDRKLECQLNGLISSLAGSEEVKGFGSSDCRCRSHLHKVLPTTLELLLHIFGEERCVRAQDIETGEEPANWGDAD